MAKEKEVRIRQAHRSYTTGPWEHILCVVYVPSKSGRWQVLIWWMVFRRCRQRVCYNWRCWGNLEELCQKAPQAKAMSNTRIWCSWGAWGRSSLDWRWCIIVFSLTSLCRSESFCKYPAVPFERHWDNAFCSVYLVTNWYWSWLWNAVAIFWGDLLFPFRRGFIHDQSVLIVSAFCTRTSYWYLCTMVGCSQCSILHYRSKLFVVLDSILENWWGVRL